MDGFCCPGASHVHSTSIRRGLVVRISAFHAGGPGSIPGVGKLLFVFVASKAVRLAPSVVNSRVRSNHITSDVLFEKNLTQALE